jgi:hypothetical protein
VVPVPGLGLLDWRAGRVVWRLADTTTNFNYIVRPGGADIAIGECQYGPNTGAWPTGPVNLVIVHGDGTSVRSATGIAAMFGQAR